MKQYSYRVFKSPILNDPVIAGSVSAHSMDDAVQCVLDRHGVQVIRTVYDNCAPDFRFEMDGMKVGVLVYANPALYHDNARYKVTERPNETNY